MSNIIDYTDLDVILSPEFLKETSIEDLINHNKLLQTKKPINTILYPIIEEEGAEIEADNSDNESEDIKKETENIEKIIISSDDDSDLYELSSDDEEQNYISAVNFIDYRDLINITSFYEDKLL